jgi:uncharacterized SAM-binding protein YcdF (DUF218 family)
VNCETELINFPLLEVKYRITMAKYDAIIVLGGGRTNDGGLTELSRQRLDKGSELYKQGVAPKVFALGGPYSTYSPNAIRFDKTGADLRSEYLQSCGVSRNGIILIPDGRETMLEAFTSRTVVRDLGFKRIMLVTSDKHMERSLYIFRRIFGRNIEIDGSEVPCGDLLNEHEEKEYLAIVRAFLDAMPDDIPDPNFDTWFEVHEGYYRQHKEIHDRYHPAGKKSQAYMGVEVK